MIRNVLIFYGCNHQEHPLSKTLSKHCNLSPNLISQFLNLIDCPQDGRCISHMKFISEYLVCSYYTEHQLRTPSAIIDSQNSIWKAIEIVAINHSTFLKTTMPVKSDNPIYAFHFDVSPYTPSNPDYKAANERAYSILAAYLHQRLLHWFNIIETEKPIINHAQYKSHLGLAARKAVRGFSGDLTKTAFHFSRLERALLPVRLEHHITSVGTRLLSHGDPSYLKDLFTRNHRNQNKRDKDKRDFFGRKKRWLTTSFPPFASITEENYQISPTSPFKSEGNQDFVEDTIINYYNENEASDNPEDATHITITQPKEWTLTAWEQRRRNIGRIENSLQTHDVQPWSSRCISLNGLKLIYQHLTHNHHLNPKIKLIVLMSILSGISSLSLLNVGFMKLPSTQDDSDIDMDAIASDFLWFDVDLGIIWWVSPGSSDSGGSYYFVDNFHEIKLPQIICDTLKEIPGYERNIRVKDFTDTRKFLNRLGTDGLMNISISRLTHTFRAYFVNGAGFPAIYADFIVGRKSAHLLSQHSYITVPQKYLVTEWHKMCTSFLRSLSSSEPLQKVLFNMKYKSIGLKDVHHYETQRCVGSALTPKISTLRQHLAGLYNKFPHNADSLLSSNDQTWNFYMAYVYIFYALCSGQRPNHSPMPSQKMINNNIKIASVSDKNNKFYKENREIHLPSSLAVLLTRHKDISKKWLFKKRIQGYSIEGDTGSFFIANSESKSLLPISPNRLDTLLIDKPSDYFSGLSNGCRHLLLTILNWDGTPQEYSDSISGHRHVGFEPTHICSPISSTQIGRHLAELIESKVLSLFELKQPIEGKINA